jgi:hypothetical protein
MSEAGGRVAEERLTTEPVGDHTADVDFVRQEVAAAEAGILY